MPSRKRPTAAEAKQASEDRTAVREIMSSFETPLQAYRRRYYELRNAGWSHDDAKAQLDPKTVNRTPFTRLGPFISGRKEWP